MVNSKKRRIKKLQVCPEKEFRYAQKAPPANNKQRLLCINLFLLQFCDPYSFFKPPRKAIFILTTQLQNSDKTECKKETKGKRKEEKEENQSENPLIGKEKLK